MKRTVFVHVPKCGGTSLDAAVRGAYRLGDKGKIDPIAARTAARKCLLAKKPRQFFAQYPRLQEYLVLFHLYSGTTFVSGHVPVTTRILNLFHQRYLFITLLRDPVDRWVSHYVFNSTVNSDPMVGPVVARLADAERLLDGFLRSWRAWQMAHLFATMFSGICPSSPATARKAVSAAKRNLRRYDAVGFLESPKVFLDRLEQLLGSALVLPHLNRTLDAQRDTKGISDLTDLFDDARRARVARLCEDDYEVYEYARNVFLLTGGG
jgi:hypothetical protein